MYRHMLSRILCSFRIKQGAYFGRTFGYMPQSANRFGLQLGKLEYSGASEPVGFDFSPYSFVGIQFGTVRRQQKQIQSAFETLHFFMHNFRFMHRMSVKNQKNTPSGTCHQAIQKPTENTGVYPSGFDHKSHFASAVHRTQHIQPIPRTGSFYDWCFPFTSPGSSCMIIASQTGFITKPDFRFFFSRDLFYLSLFDVRFLFFMARNYNVSSEISSRVPAQ